jgi:hypothetical protein
MAISLYHGMTLNPGQWPEAGDMMFFLGRNGYDGERARAALHFEVGRYVEVVECYVGRSDHNIAFKGVEGQWNGCMFEHVEGPRRDEVAAFYKRF